MKHMIHKLEAWLADELSARDAAEVQEHLDTCLTCATRAEELRKVWDLLGVIESTEPRKPSIWPAVQSRTVGVADADVLSGWFFGERPTLRAGLAASAMAAGLALAFLLPAGEQATISAGVVAGLDENSDMQWVAESTLFGNDTGGFLDELWLGASLENEEGGS